MRVLDLLRSQRFRMNEGRFEPVRYVAPPEMMAEAEVILADNVAEYFEKTVHLDGYLRDESISLVDMMDTIDLPVLAPSFPRMFIEYSSRSSMVGIVTPGIRMSGRVRLGTFLRAQVLGDGRRARMQRRFGREVKWRIDGEMYLEPIPFRILGPIMQLRLLVHENGEMEYCEFGLCAALARKEDGDVRAISARCMFMPLLLTICFLNCKNVELKTVRPERTIPKQFKRRPAMPYTEYKVLDIRPLRTILRNEGRVHEVGLKQALHICRGHFKTYTANAPLFGQIEGTYWWGNFTRGSGPARVIKDYRVHAPVKDRDRLMDGEIN